MSKPIEFILIDGYPVKNEIVYKMLWGEVIPISNARKFIVDYNQPLLDKLVLNDVVIRYEDKRFDIESMINNEATLTITGKEIK